MGDKHRKMVGIPISRTRSHYRYATALFENYASNASGVIQLIQLRFPRRPYERGPDAFQPRSSISFEGTKPLVFGK
jgi:hypothetical protein